MQETLARWQFAFTSVNHFFFVPVTIGLAVLTAMLQAAWQPVSAWQLRHGGDRAVFTISATSRIFLWCATWMAVLPFGMNTAGWLLTESGRQPWIVQGIMLTRNGLSTSVSAAELWISVIGFVLLYGTLGTIDLILMLRYSRKQPEPPAAEQDTGKPIPAVQY